MRSRLLVFSTSVSLLFYCVIPFLYLFPRIVGNNAIGTVMFTVGFAVVTPTWVALVVHLCGLGLRTRSTSSRSGSQP